MLATFRHILKRFSRTFTNTQMADSGRLVWIDLEMTGLDVRKDTILEIACVVTDGELQTISQTPSIVIHHDEETLAHMSEWCKDHHGKSGLTEAVQKSNISLAEAESMVIEFLRKHTAPQECPLAGNSVHVDKQFLKAYMPRIVDHLHYRIVDVSTVKELCRRWYPNDFAGYRKAETHRSSDDILESIEELCYYRRHIFKA